MHILHVMTWHMNASGTRRSALCIPSGLMGHLTPGVWSSSRTTSTGKLAGKNPPPHPYPHAHTHTPTFFAIITTRAPACACANRITPNIEAAIDLVPSLGEVGFKTIVNGPTIWTGDALPRCGRTLIPGWYVYTCNFLRHQSRLFQCHEHNLPTTHATISPIPLFSMVAPLNTELRIYRG